MTMTRSNNCLRWDERCQQGAGSECATGKCNGSTVRSSYPNFLKLSVCVDVEANFFVTWDPIGEGVLPLGHPSHAQNLIWTHKSCAGEEKGSATRAQNCAVILLIFVHN
jgi:hypothetical protein